MSFRKETVTKRYIIFFQIPKLVSVTLLAMAMEFAIKKLDSVIVIEITVDMTAAVITILEALWGGINRSYPDIPKFKKSH